MKIKLQRKILLWVHSLAVVIIFDLKYKIGATKIERPNVIPSPDGRKGLMAILGEASAGGGTIKMTDLGEKKAGNHFKDRRVGKIMS
jgi:hypothetical protein